MKHCRKRHWSPFLTGVVSGRTSELCIELKNIEGYSDRNVSMLSGTVKHTMAYHIQSVKLSKKSDDSPFLYYAT